MRPPLLLFIFFTLLLSSCSPSHSLLFSKYRNILSLSHSLASRVATLRAERGDYEGAARAEKFAGNLEPGLNLGFYKFVWNVGWDYAKNYAWSRSSSTASFGALGGVFSDLNELSRVFTELNRLESNAERVAWVGRNYESALRVFKSLFARLIVMCRQSGPLRELVEALQKEVFEGDLLKDCLELGANDLKGLIMVFKDIAFQYASSPLRNEL